jgi:hypothetical protein
MANLGFNPYAPPTADLESRPDEVNAWRQGRLLVYREAVPLPGRCYQCNQTTTQRLSRKLYWVPVWPWLLFFFGPMLSALGRYSQIFPILGALAWPTALLLLLVLRKRTELDYAICGRHRTLSQWLRGIAVGFLAANIGCSYLLASGTASGEGLLVIALALLGIAILLAVADNIRFGVAPRRIREGKVWLRGCGRPFLDSLPEYHADGRDAG